MVRDQLVYSNLAVNHKFELIFRKEEAGILGDHVLIFEPLVRFPVPATVMNHLLNPWFQ